MNTRISLLFFFGVLSLSCARHTDHQVPWTDAVVYEIFVRSFYDSDGDGIGDLKGVQMKLDYIQELGANALWLMPIFQSPSDHCYDVSDYYQIQEDYGSMEDFDSLLKECKKRGIRIILDLVLNHTSSQHPWFLKSLDNIAPYDEYYIWADEPPGGDWYIYAHDEKIENGGWRFHEEKGQYFYAYFTTRMPDLNLENPAVRADVKKIARFWLEKGVDGFRLDAAQNVIEEGPGEGLQYDSPSTVSWWVEFNAYVKSINPDAALVGEIWASPYDLGRYHANGKGLDLCFNFPLQFAIPYSLNKQSADSIIAAIREVQSQEAPSSYFSPFLSNHDQARYMTTLDVDFNKAALAAVLLFTAPGTPFMYYGEEVGMHQADFSHNTTRTPMQWTSDPVTAGFTSGPEPWSQPGKNMDPFNVEFQRSSDHSLLKLYQTLARIRHSHPALRYGGYEFHTFDDQVLAFHREYEGQSILVLINLSNKVKEMDQTEFLGEYQELVFGQTITIEEGFEMKALEFLVLE